MNHGQQKRLQRTVFLPRILLPNHPFLPARNELSTNASRKYLLFLQRSTLSLHFPPKLYSWNHIPNQFHLLQQRQKQTQRPNACDVHGHYKNRQWHHNRIQLYHQIPIHRVRFALTSGCCHNKVHLQNGCKRTSLL